MCSLNAREALFLFQSSEHELSKPQSLHAPSWKVLGDGRGQGTTGTWLVRDRCERITSPGDGKAGDQTRAKNNQEQEAGIQPGVMRQKVTGKQQPGTEDSGLGASSQWEGSWHWDQARPGTRSPELHIETPFLLQKMRGG